MGFSDSATKNAEVWAALAGLTIFFTMTVAFRVRLKSLKISGKSLWLLLPVYCLTALLKISVFERTRILCRTLWFKGVAVLWLFISLLISSLHEAEIIKALIEEPEFVHPKNFSSVLRLNYSMLLLEKHPNFYKKTSDFVS